MQTTKNEQNPTVREINLVLDHCDAITAAAQAGKSSEEIIQMGIAMPLFPKAAKSLAMMIGKKRFLKMGYDRTRADVEYGKKWLDEVDAKRRELMGGIREPKFLHTLALNAAHTVKTVTTNVRIALEKSQEQ